MRKYTALVFVLLLLSTRVGAEQNVSIEPEFPEEGGRVRLSFFLPGDAFRSPDELSFELTEGLSLVEYKLSPGTGGSQVFITLEALEAGRQGLLAVTAKKAGKSTRFEAAVLFNVMGTVRIQGSWEFSNPIYQYGPFTARLKLSRQVPDSVYNLVLVELQKRYTSALLGDGRFLFLPDTSFDLPDISVKIHGQEASEGVSTVLAIASAHAETKSLPALTQWVGSGLPSYRLEASGEYETGEKLVLRVSLEGAGIPLGLAGLFVAVKTEAGFREVMLSFSTVAARIQDLTVVSRLEGTLELVLDTPGVMELSAAPILAFKTGSQALVRVSPAPLRFEVREKPGQPLEQEKLREIVLKPSSARWMELYKNYDKDSEFLQAAKTLDLKPWSPEYEARIALSLSSGDLCYARYELLRAERNFLPGFIQKRYPLLYVGARPVFVLPASWLLAVLLVLSLAVVVVLFVCGRKRIKGLKPALVSALAVSALSLALLLLSAAERASAYGVVSKSVVRKVPDAEATVLSVCEEGTVVKILQAAGDWVYAQTGTVRGWIERQDIRYALR